MGERSSLQESPCHTTEDAQELCPEGKMKGTADVLPVSLLGKYKRTVDRSGNAGDLLRFPQEESAPVFVRSREWLSKGWRRRRVGVRVAGEGAIVLERPGGKTKASDMIRLRSVTGVHRYELKQEEAVGIATAAGTEFRFGQIGVVLEAGKEKIKLATSTIEAAEELSSWLLNFADMSVRDASPPPSLALSFVTSSDLLASPRGSFGKPESELDLEQTSTSLSRHTSSPKGGKGINIASSQGSPCSYFSPASSPFSRVPQFHLGASPTGGLIGTASEGCVSQSQPCASLCLPNPVITMGDLPAESVLSGPDLEDDESDREDASTTVISAGQYRDHLSRGSSPAPSSTPQMDMSMPLGVAAHLGGSTPSSSPLLGATRSQLSGSPTTRTSLLSMGASPIRLQSAHSSSLAAAATNSGHLVASAASHTRSYSTIGASVTLSSVTTTSSNGLAAHAPKPLENFNQAPGSRRSSGATVCSPLLPLSDML